MPLAYAAWLASAGRVMFGAGIAALGAQHVVLGDFVTGRAPAWPAGVPGQEVWAWTSGALLIAAGICMATAWHAVRAAIVTAALIVVWALTRHVSVVAASAVLSPEWTSAGKALTLMGGAMAVAATSRAGSGTRGLARAVADHRSSLLLMARLALGTFLVITGIQHFLFTPFVASLIPAWFPGDAVFWTWFAGVALIAGGIGLWLPPTTHLAALLSGLMVFSWVWIVHVPRTLTTVSDGLAVFEALAVSGIAFMLSHRTPHTTGSPR